MEADTDNLTDLELHAHEETARLSLKANLRLIDTICTSNIPLYLIAGSPLEIYSENANTQEWLLELLSPHHLQEESSSDVRRQSSDWWVRPGTQSVLGYLLEVESKEDAHVKSLPKLTQLLLYAATLSHGSNEAILPTPPPSSPSTRDIPEMREPETLDTAPSIVFRALPICSSASQIACQNKARLALGEHAEPCFIDIEVSQLDHIVDQVKGRELTLVFDDAFLQKKKLKRRGGEAVGHFVTDERDRLVLHRDQNSSTKKMRMNDRHTVNDSLGKGRARQPSRSLSITSALCESIPRPPKKQLFPLKQGQSQLQGGHSTVPMPGPPMLDPYTNEIEQQNKSSISRIIMAGMRMHGLQQKRNATQNTTLSPDIESALSSHRDEETDEYKLVYHQTFKATTFLFRRQMRSRLLGADDLWNNIDRLLAIFCSDPLNTSISHRATRGYFGTDNDDKLNAFDEPTARLRQP